jgi:uncharacterized protein involved in exopolysaccharide biosynthesis/protein involved in polysaccharide export with SLBB domain
MNENNVNSVKHPQKIPSSMYFIDFKQIKSIVVINCHWFVYSVISFVLLAFLYLWFTPTKYSVEGKMEIIDKSKKNSALSSGMAMLNSLPMGLGSAIGGNLGGSLGIDTEKEIITSNSLVKNVVKDLTLYIDYRLCKWGRKELLYQNQPINVTLDPAHVEWLDSELPLYFHQINLTISKDGNGYTVETMLKENKKKNYLPDQKFASLPASIKTDAGVLTITENNLLTTEQSEIYSDGYKLRVVINPPMETADNFISRISVNPPSKKVTNLLNISISDESIMRGIDFVNNLVDAYNNRANDEKNEEARKTDEFVNARLAKIDAELGSSDADWERYKKQFQITEPEVDAQEVMTKKSLYETQLVEIGTQLQLHDYLNEYINDPANLYEIIPLSIGASNISAKDGDNSAVATQSASLIAQHNSLVSQRKDFLKSMSEKAPQVERVTESIKELHPVIKTAMKRDRQSILLKRSNVEREYSRYMGRVGSAPQQERVLTEIGRQREIKQGVYLLMLQKREETAMELANVTNKGKLIDTTTVVKSSAKPQTKMVLLFAIVMGLILPLAILYLKQMLKDKIDTCQDINNISKSPVIGEIPLSDQSEAIRNLRTNLLLSIENGQKVIMLASYFEGDGKTYIAKQLTDSLTAIGKNVLTMDLDMRSKASSEHPADILASNKFAEQMRKAKEEYDFVIVDTPAISKYSDVYQIAKFADITCYIIKAEQTAKSAVEQLKKENRLPNVRFILNAIDMKKKKYRYYYKHVLAFIAAMFIFSACGSSEKVVYLDNANQVNLEASKVLFDAKIMPKDVLSITVSTINPEAAKPFNLIVPTVVAGEITTSTTQPVMQSYLVNNDGTIDYPIIGVIKVGGLTKTECEAMILEKIRPYLAESEKPIVTVRMSSYSISVLGEVKTPGSFPVSREKINIFEALAMAGDMTIYGIRDHVRLIREDASGKKEIHMLDLTDANVINSPYYYLQQNDIIYVEPSKVKKQDARVGSMTNLWFSATSILVSLASIIVTIAK